MRHEQKLLNDERAHTARFACAEQVLSVLDGNVKLSYSGHRKVAYGIQMALLDNPLIQSVDFEYLD